MSVVGLESDDGGAVVGEVRPGLRPERLTLIRGTLQGADGEGGVQAGAEVLVPHASLFIFRDGDAVIAAVA